MSRLMPVAGVPIDGSRWVRRGRCRQRSTDGDEEWRCAARVARVPTAKLGCAVVESPARPGVMVAAMKKVTVEGPV
jgi:hypothetical protein